MNRLTESEVATIRQKLASGQSRRIVANEYHVTLATIGKIARGETWIDVITPIDLENAAIESAARLRLLLGDKE